MVELQVIALRIPDRSAIPAKEAVANDIVKRARAEPERFCDLVKQYTDDVSMHDSCGSRGLVWLRELLPTFRAKVDTMHEGDISDPIVVDDAAVVLFKLVRREGPPPSYALSVETLRDIKNSIVPPNGRS